VRLPVYARYIGADVPWQLYPTTAFTQFVPEWDALVEDVEGPPFLSSAFLLPLLAQFGSGSEQLAICREGDAITGAALVARRSAGVWDTFQPSQLPLGPWLVRRGHDPVAIARALLHRLPGLALQLGLTQLDPRMYARPGGGEDASTLDYVQTAALAVDGTFDDYWAARGKNLRANMRKQRNRLLADGVVARFDVLTRPDDVAGAIDAYGRLESAGWKAATGTAIARDNAQGRFYRAMLENFCSLGRGRMYRLCFGDRVVAMDLCIEGGDVQVVLKTTYDETISNLSPAFLLREEELRKHFTDRRVRRVEFFGKVMDWHLQWTRDTRMVYHVNITRFPRLARLRARWASRGASTPGPADGVSSST
jgi:CelD/BcsL family acetyltransferase involved in cellulose biosynthesis